MKPSDSNARHRPFKNLKAFLESNHFRLSCEPAEHRCPDMPIGRTDPGEERRLFLKAMADVDRIRRDKHVATKRRPIPPIRDRSHGDSSVLACLEKIVKTGEGFVIALTPEYVAGSSEKVHPEIVRRLHEGQYTIQDHIDLHGMNVGAAQQAFDEFMKSCTLTGKQGILIVHGRGLSSAAEPVLKTRVVRWLTRGPWRKWIIAYSSARSCDGGTGATYVLLRTSRPAQRALEKERFSHRAKRSAISKKGA